MPSRLPDRIAGADRILPFGTGHDIAQRRTGDDVASRSMRSPSCATVRQTAGMMEMLHVMLA
jgi:hypothetical protein